MPQQRKGTEMPQETVPEDRRAFLASGMRKASLPHDWLHRGRGIIRGLIICSSVEVGQGLFPGLVRRESAVDPRIEVSLPEVDAAKAP